MRLLLMIPLILLGTLQSLAQTDTLPPIITTYKLGARWYDFHENRVFNLNKKFKLFHAQEAALLEAWKLNKQLNESKIELENSMLKQKIEIDKIRDEFHSNNLKIYSLQESNIELSTKYNAQVEYSKLLEKSLRRQRLTTISIGGLSLAGIIYFLIK